MRSVAPPSATASGETVDPPDGAAATRAPVAPLEPAVVGVATDAFRRLLDARQGYRTLSNSQLLPSNAAEGAVIDARAVTRVAAAVGGTLGRSSGGGRLERLTSQRRT